MRKRGRKQREPTQYTAADFSSDSDEEVQQRSKRSKDHSAYVSSLSRDGHRIIAKLLSFGLPTPMKRPIQPTTDSASMDVDEAAGSSGGDSSGNSEGSNSSNGDPNDSNSSSSTSGADRSSSGSSSISEGGEMEDIPWAGIDDPAPSSPKDREQRKKEQYLDEWIGVRSEYLCILMIGEGRGAGSHSSCRRCNIGGRIPRYRCRDCFSLGLLCKECTLESHQERPLDIIEMWNGRFFEHITLVNMGLVVQLGHLSNTLCPAPNSHVPKNFTVLHTNGLHRIRVQYCGCGEAGELLQMRQQLLSHQWYPATTKVPQTCFTFRLLEHYHMMTLVGKITSYDYYRGLEKLTDNSGSFAFKNRYDAFRRVTREWRHLKSLKRGGRGNDASRTIEHTEPGELAVLCPACPRPGINLPDDWTRAKENERFIYTFFLAVDACFRLKWKMVSSEASDPGFGTGWSYMVPDVPYRQYLLGMTSATE
ncbi:hypothetical protein VNI00_018477, partial [Paramarasmius palmivorus]